MYLFFADILIVAHFTFILFVVFGGLLLLKWKWLIYIHVPAVIWAAMIEFFGWVCPLTPLENYFRDLAGSEAYSGGFIDHYIVPIVYPTGLTPTIQFTLGFLVIAINLVIYSFVFWKHWKKR